MKEHDIVMTQDIPLAAEVIEKGGIAIHPRGEDLYYGQCQSALTSARFYGQLTRSGRANGRAAHRFQNGINANFPAHSIRPSKNKNVKLPRFKPYSE